MKQSHYLSASILACGLSIMASTASASPIIDPAGDFLATYQGPQGGDLDVISANVTLVGNNSFQFFAQLAAPIGTTAGAFYVFGINRGAGTAGFASLGLNNVLFDRVVLLQQNGTGTVAGVGAIDPSRIRINGSTITADIPVSFFPSTGFSLDNYGWNLWPRAAGTFTPGTGAISDFAPNNSTPRVDRIPLPGTVSLAAAGLLALGLARRRQRN